MGIFPGNSSRSEPALLPLYLFLCYASLVVASVWFLMMNIISALLLFWFGLDLMVFNATFINISIISWRSVLLVEETGGPGKNHRPVASHRQTLSNYL